MYQRPQHLLSRVAKYATVHVWEEPAFRLLDEPLLEISITEQGVRIITPILPECQRDKVDAYSAQRQLLDRYLDRLDLAGYIAWYYSPMALQFTDHLSPSLIVYDCMDELSGFRGASPSLIDEERRLFDRADVVFAGGASLYASKRTQHGNVHLFASSVDRSHFSTARTPIEDPEDQISIPHPRIGFFGVLDERLDCDLLCELAAYNPQWHFVLIGPLAKIREEDLPRSSNLHYLGQKSYAELPSYLGNWEVAILPFARNAATRYISPTKTPEYLAGGRPVVSTPIQDVVKPYADLGLVRIGATANEFAEAIQQSLGPCDAQWLEKVDAFLANNSWDKTFEGMWAEIQRCIPDSRAESAMNQKSA